LKLFKCIIKRLLPPKIIPLEKRQALCLNCGWNGEYIKAKHYSTIQSMAARITNEDGKIIDSTILAYKKRNCNKVDLTFCPDCRTLIQIYLDEP